jgi:hypothetical protein
VLVNPGFSQADLGGWGIRRSPERREMMKGVCAFKTRYIRYIVDSQAFNPLHNALQTRYRRYSVDGEGLTSMAMARRGQQSGSLWDEERLPELNSEAISLRKKQRMMWFSDPIDATDTEAVHDDLTPA